MVCLKKEPHTLHGRPLVSVNKRMPPDYFRPEDRSNGGNLSFEILLRDLRLNLCDDEIHRPRVYDRTAESLVDGNTSEFKTLNINK